MHSLGCAGWLLRLGAEGTGACRAELARRLRDEEVGTSGPIDAVAADRIDAVAADRIDAVATDRIDAIRWLEVPLGQVVRVA